MSEPKPKPNGDVIATRLNQIAAMLGRIEEAIQRLNLTMERIRKGV
jgi:hypothetical protein